MIYVRTYTHEDNRHLETVKRLRAMGAQCSSDYMSWDKRPITITVYQPSKQCLGLLKHLNFRRSIT